MKKIFFVIIILLACSQEKDKSISYYLTNDSSKYWNKIYQTKEYEKIKITYPKYRYYFDTRGNWRTEIFLKDSFENLLTGGDVIYPETWYYLNDSTLIIGTFYAHILNLNEDTFKFINLITKDTLIFRSSIGDTSFNNRAIIDSIKSVLRLIKNGQNTNSTAKSQDSGVFIK